MSASPSRNRPAPLHQRSPSQNNTLAIRVVPYTPPRIQADGLSPSLSVSSHPHDAPEGARGAYDDMLTGGENRSRTRESFDGKSHLVSSQGFALPSGSSSSLRLVEPKGKGVSDFSGEAVRPLPSPVKVTPSELAAQPAAAAHPEAQQHEAAGATPLRPLSRNRNFVAIHSDKTFSLVRQGPRSDSSRSLVSPQPSHSSRASSSLDRPSIGEWSDDHRASSPLTNASATLPDRSLSPSDPSPSSSTTQLAEDPITQSPWNYHLVGGLRKVPKTPDLKQKATRYPISPSSDSSPLSPLPEVPPTPNDDVVVTPTARSVVAKSSFASTETASTTAETTNYKVYGHSPAQTSSDSLAPTFSSQSNYVVLGESSPVAPFSSSPPAAPFSSSPPDTPDSNENYVVHGEPSPSPSAAAAIRKPRPTYSQESLRVPPLRPSRKRTSHERFGYYKHRSRENLRARAGSVKGINTSISSVISSQEAAQTFVDLSSLQGAWSSPSTPGNSSSQQQQQQDSWEALPPLTGSSAGLSRSPSNSPPPRNQMLQSQPHQWSSQLSTVMSESEGGSSRGNSPSASRASTGNGAGHRRRSSAGWNSSMHSRQLQSISSSLAAQLEEGTGDSGGSMSRSDSIERPYPAYTRAGPSGSRMVRDQDEDGDGLADLHEMAQRPSKSGLSGFFASSDSSSRMLHSSGSSRAGSFSSASIPTWARYVLASARDETPPLPFLFSTPKTQRFLTPPTEYTTAPANGVSSVPPLFQALMPGIAHPAALHSMGRQIRITSHCRCKLPAGELTKSFPHSTRGPSRALGRWTSLVDLQTRTIDSSGR